MFAKGNNKSLVKSLIFLLFGSLVFAYPDKVISLVSSAFGAILILYGLFMIVRNHFETKNNTNTPTTLLTFGIVLVIVGILFIILSDTISYVIQYVIGAWILFNGLEKLITSLYLPKHTNQFVTQLVISILLLAAGLYTILVSNLTIQVLGLIMMLYAVLEIIVFITGKNILEKDQNAEDKKDKTAKKNVIEAKDAKVIEDKNNKNN